MRDHVAEYIRGKSGRNLDAIFETIGILIKENEFTKKEVEEIRVEVEREIESLESSAATIEAVVEQHLLR